MPLVPAGDEAHAASQLLEPGTATRAHCRFEGTYISDPPVTYLNDHLGGVQIAVQVLDAMRDQHDDPKFREFANTLLPEIEADDRILRSIAEKIGSVPAWPSKRAVGSLKNSRV